MTLNLSGFFLPEERRQIEIFALEDIGSFTFEASTRRRIERELALRVAAFDAELELWRF